MTEGIQSGDDTPLKNVWDEVCVQMQQAESLMWDAYILTMKSIVAREVQILETPIKQAIWLQTDDGMQWEDDDEDDDEHKRGGTVDCPYNEDEITEYILSDFVLSAAASWTNKRITKYLEMGAALDDN